MTRTGKRKNDQDEGKQLDNNNITDEDQKVFGLVNFDNWNYTFYKREIEAENALNAMRSIGVSNSIKLMSASSREGLIALIDNEKKQTFNQGNVGNNNNTAISPAAQVTPVKKKMKTLKVQRTVKNPYVNYKLSAHSSASSTPYLDELLRKGIKFCVTIFTPDTPDQTHPYKCITVDLRDTKRNETYWVHKPEFWAEMFYKKELITSPLIRNIPDLFSNFSFGKKRLTANGSNLPSVFNTPKSNRQVERQLLYAVIDGEATKDDIAEQFKFWKLIAKDADFRTAYYHTVASKISSKAFLDGVAEGAEYWKKLEQAATNIEFMESHQLTDELMDEDIKDIVNTVYPNNAGPVPCSLWTPSMVAYAGAGFTKSD